MYREPVKFTDCLILSSVITVVILTLVALGDYIKSMIDYIRTMIESSTILQYTFGGIILALVLACVFWAISNHEPDDYYRW